MRVLAQKQSFSTGKLVIILLENQQQPREAPIGNEVRTKKAKNKKKKEIIFLIEFICWRRCGCAVRRVCRVYAVASFVITQAKIK